MHEKKREKMRRNNEHVRGCSTWDTHFVSDELGFSIQQYSTSVEFFSTTEARWPVALYRPPYTYKSYGSHTLGFPVIATGDSTSSQTAYSLYVSAFCSVLWNVVKGKIRWPHTSKTRHAEKPRARGSAFCAPDKNAFCARWEHLRLSVPLKIRISAFTLNKKKIKRSEHRCSR